MIAECNTWIRLCHGRISKEFDAMRQVDELAGLNGVVPGGVRQYGHYLWTALML